MRRARSGKESSLMMWTEQVRFLWCNARLLLLRKLLVVLARPPFLPGMHARARTFRTNRIHVRKSVPQPEIVPVHCRRG